MAYDFYKTIKNPPSFLKTSQSIKSVLNQNYLTEADFQSLLSFDAGNFLEEMAQAAQKVTLQNFGRVVSLYTPLYLSNHCDNECLYCGFNSANSVQRKVLSMDEVQREADKIDSTGVQHILILTGESRTYSPLSYIKECVKRLSGQFVSVCVEIYPLTQEEYQELVCAGADGLTIYQETYNEELYASLHASGPKRDYHFRLGAPQRGCVAGMRQVHIGALLGLGDWREEVFHVGLHARGLAKAYGDVEVGVALPRFQSHEGASLQVKEVSDKEFIQILCALRLFLPRAGISISTRELNAFRKNCIGLGVTRMSAGSHTEVGGYACDEKTEGQFDIADKSSVDDVKAMIYERGYQPVLKDWQAV